MLDYSKNNSENAMPGSGESEAVIQDCMQNNGSQHTRRDSRRRYTGGNPYTNNNNESGMVSNQKASQENANRMEEMPAVMREKPDCRLDKGGTDVWEAYTLAMAYVPWQHWSDELYALDYALNVGTIFPALDKPFCIGRCARR